MTTAQKDQDNGRMAGVGPVTNAEKGTREKVVRRVVLRGLVPIMFSRYAGDNETKLENWQKLYYGTDQKTLVLPSANIMSFLSAQNTDSAPKRILDSKHYKKFCNACRAYVLINPSQIAFMRDDKPIVFGKFNAQNYDPKSGVHVERHTARLEKGIPNPVERPVLDLPWELQFELTLLPNPVLQEQQLLNVFTRGGYEVGLGTFRPIYGKFEIAHWE